eukprot:TRINITY_DN464_c0_g1_i9.p2 TRINITY_DN464_c0_g1~~TRINITY_DN464_c0_g1_i9.p2  ORF type:complete len:129 (-),score=49.83 TRINITY_DN464_c0_g1_i9:214-600(-)
MVLITKQQKRVAYNHLLEEGVIVVKKDVHLKKHQTLDMPNLNLMCIMKSLKSKQFVTEIFSWNWYYYTVNKEGIKFLCQYLGKHALTVGVSEQVKPKFMKPVQRKPGEEDFGEKRPYDRRERTSKDQG